VKFYGQSPAAALGVGTQIHTSPQAFGKVMSTVKPRHAIAYHFFNEEATRYGILQGIEETYGGPLSLASDNMVWNITADGITERMAVSPDQAWSVPGPELPPKPPARGSVPDPVTEFIKSGRWDVDDVQGEMIENFEKQHGLE
jgi:ribonuclease Z